MATWKTAGKVRMTPKGTWSSNTAYDILDCVVSADGYTYYIAKQAVPSGTALNNTEYWSEMVDVSGAISDMSDTVDALEDRVDDLEYVPIDITSISISTPSSGVAEKGSTVSAVTVNWVISGKPVSLSLNGSAVTPVTSTSKALTGLNLTNNTAFTLTATDAGSASHAAKTATKAATLYFYNNVYYGVAAAPSTVNSAFVTGLASKTLTGTRARTISVKAGSNQYIWYAVPTGLGACSFNVGGFDGGFQAAQTVSVTNESGYTDDYFVYRSTNANLGDTSVKVS
jgi:hypothetical protein